MADMKELAGRIDPRIYRTMEPGLAWRPETTDLIAASDALREAADMLTVLQSQVAVARKMALSEAAMIVRGKVYKEHYRTYPQYHQNGGNMSNEAEAVKLCDTLADAIDALSPTLDIDALVERATMALVKAKAEYRQQAQYSYDTVLARAVLSAIGLGRGE